MHQYDEAVTVLDDLLGIISKDANFKGNEVSNILVYKLAILRDMKKWDAVAQLLEARDKDIKDQLFKTQLRYELATHQSDKPNRLKYLDELLRLNPDDAKYVLDYSQLSDKPQKEQIETLTGEYKSSMARILYLEKIIDDEELWRKELQTHLNKMAQKFVPSTSFVLKTLAKNESRSKFIDELLQKSLDSYTNTGKLLDSDVFEDPTVELFFFMLISHRHMDKGNYKEAVEFARKAAAHTPSFEDAFIQEARALIKLGEFEQACHAAREAQRLNTADRGIASNVCHVLLKSLRVEEADEKFKRFMRGTTENVEKNIHDLQMFEYERQRGIALIKQGRWREGLRQLSFVMEIESTYFDDQYDFYGYALRKFNALPLYQMLKYNDEKLCQNKLLVKGILKYIRYLRAFSLLLDKSVEEKPLMAIFPAEASKQFDLSGSKIDKKFVEEELTKAIGHLKKVNIASLSKKTLA